MHIIDTHCDTLTKIFNQKKKLFKNDLHIDILRLKNYSSFAQTFACFIAPEYKDKAFSYAKSAFEYFNSELLKNSEYIGVAKNYREYCDLKNAGKIAAFFSIEGGEAIEKISDIDYFYKLGVRMIALTWNYDNKIASGVLGDENRGITDFGKEVISKMNKKGILLDTSHLNEKSFWEAAKLSKLPLVASHSNSYSVCKNKRNLTDEQFLEIKRRDGYVGINLYPFFLTGNEKAGISDILKNIEHFLSLGGENIIGLGCDFDGVDFLPDEISGVENLEKIFDKMAALGYPGELMDKIAHKNFEKLIKLF